ncbi:glycosyltransferase family 2 protein [Pedobacter cryophilus]|uniref:Glycosyltransferase family 2 protein n=1 Tax=Pedobacter cryophilus TaxID=2571271 RepID=A0A4U1C3D6_9SPHI|nr:glycosyltransferase family 2 protein [Pedobacter cryophilus]TKB98619.1 glycosyltransferase family 2 protein [Pedobacter cryophilus]
MKISICIPTYNRREFLEKAILSCFFESNYQFEILIGDDSTIPSLSQKDLQSFLPQKNYEIKYFHHKKALKQNKNVDFLIKQTTGDYCVIMHDDDSFTSEGLICLLKKLEELNFPNNLILYGKQKIIDQNDIENKNATDNLNLSYQRSVTFVGLQTDNIKATLLQRCPSNGFLISGAQLRKLGYRDYETAGDACDIDLIIRATILYDLKLYFVNEFVSNYRISKDSISKLSNNNAIVFKYKILDEFGINKKYPSLHKKILTDEYILLFGSYLNLKKYKEAKEFYFSKQYPFYKRFTPRGIYHLIKLGQVILK